MSCDADDETPWTYKGQKQPKHTNSRARSQRSTADVIYGSNTRSSIKAVSPSKSKDKTVKGVFISRIKPHTSALDIKKHVLLESGIDISVEKCKTKYDSYTSFYIPCSINLANQLLNKQLWPKGSLVKLYEE